MGLLQPIIVWLAEGSSSELFISAWEALEISGSVCVARRNQPRRWCLSVFTAGLLPTQVCQKQPRVYSCQSTDVTAHGSFH